MQSGGFSNIGSGRFTFGSSTQTPAPVPLPSIPVGPPPTAPTRPVFTREQMAEINGRVKAVEALKNKMPGESLKAFIMRTPDVNPEEQQFFDDELVGGLGESLKDKYAQYIPTQRQYHSGTVKSEPTPNEERGMYDVRIYALKTLPFHAGGQILSRALSDVISYGKRLGLTKEMIVAAISSIPNRKEMVIYPFEYYMDFRDEAETARNPGMVGAF
jgi:hypothetical protein